MPWRSCQTVLEGKPASAPRLLPVSHTPVATVCACDTYASGTANQDFERTSKIHSGQNVLSEILQDSLCQPKWPVSSTADFVHRLLVKMQQEKIGRLCLEMAQHALCGATPGPPGSDAPEQMPSSAKNTGNSQG